MDVYICFLFTFCQKMDKTTFSFGFTKRTEVKKLQSSAIKDNEQDRKEETDYLVSVEENQIKRFVSVVRVFYCVNVYIT